MKSPIFTGSGVAIVTPFCGGALNLRSFKQMLDRQIAAGTDAIIVCGTTGEAATMSYREKMQIIECCVEHVNGRVPVIAGSGSNSTEQAVALSKDIEKLGVDGLLIVTPYYNKATQSGLVRHYTVLADAVTTPIILYNVPSRTGVTMQPETYAELSKHPNIVGVKEASGNLSNVQKTRNLCPEDFSIWSGNDDEVVPVCALGGSGVISVVANVLPAEMHMLVKMCLENNYVEAGKLQLYLKNFCDTMFCEVNPIPVKTALNLMGMEAGELRLPLCAPSHQHEAQIREVLVAYNLLPA